MHGSCTGSCNVLSFKICVPKETRNIYFKAFNLITNKDEAEAMTDQKWNNKTCQCECKNYRKYEENYNWNPSTCICENSKYLKSISDTSVTIVFIKTVIAMNNLSTNTIATNITSTASINFHNKKVRDCYILHTVLLLTILLLIITIICHHYAKQKGTMQSRK